LSQSKIYVELESDHTTLVRVNPSALMPPPDDINEILPYVDTLALNRFAEASVLCSDIRHFPEPIVNPLAPPSPMRFLARQNTDQADAPNYFTFFKNILKSFSVEAQSLEPFVVKKY
jgi:hypothetical protein